MKDFQKIALSLAVATALGFSGCGSSDDNTTTPTGSTNQPPVASAGADYTVTLNDTVTLNASSSTDDGHIVSYRWSEAAEELSTEMSFNITTLSAGTHTITLTVTDNQGAIATDEVVVTVDALAITTIISPTTGYIWMDRNLGASQACTSFNDTACYGDYYQWGRAADGHEKSNSATVEVTSSQTSVNPGHAKFITDDENSTDDGAERDWISNDADGSKRASWNPCPSGFRIPTRAEIDAEHDNGNGIADIAEAFDKLKLPSAGFRDYDDGLLYYQGSGSNVWSSGVSGSHSGSMDFGSTDAVSYDVYRAYGLSVRCFKD